MQLKVYLCHRTAVAGLHTELCCCRYTYRTVQLQVYLQDWAVAGIHTGLKLLVYFQKRTVAGILNRTAVNCCWTVQSPVYLQDCVGIPTILIWSLFFKITWNIEKF